MTLAGKLKAEGFTDQDIERFYSPIGLAILAETPAEIAISVAGELIMVRARREGRTK
jgi:xanthine dehydrogenase accessory factor